MLPRNISSASTATKLISTYDKYIDSIPEFLKSFYEKNSNPALIQSIAGKSEMLRKLMKNCTGDMFVSKALSEGKMLWRKTLNFVL